jgi:hypothetical protein
VRRSWPSVQAGLDARPMPERIEARMIQRMDTSGTIRRARSEDCEFIARIYNEAELLGRREAA